MKCVGATAGAAFIGVTVFCLLILNMFGGIASGIWLAILGEWRFILGGIAASFVMPWAYTVAALPAFGIGALILAFGNPPNRLAVAVLGFVASIWQSSLIGLWTFLVFFAFMRHSHEVAAIPLLIWGYSTTMAPLTYMARGEGPDNTGTSLTLMLAVIGYALLAILYFFDVTIGTMLIALGIAVVAESTLATSLGVAMTPSKTRRMSDEFRDESQRRANIEAYLFGEDDDLDEDDDVDDEDDDTMPSDTLESLQHQLARHQRDLQLLDDPDTLFAFGQMSYDGDGVAQNYVEAAAWFRNAAEHGHVQSQHNLGQMYEEGKGLPKDLAEAAKWYELAATAGNASSQNNLGTLFETGQGVGQDVVRAAKLYKQAALNGDLNALPNIKRLTAGLKQAALNGDSKALDDFERVAAALGEDKAA